MGNISPKTLSHRLKMLEEIGFVQRQAFLEIPPRVEYRLTEKGLALVDIMEAIKRFGQRYLSKVDPPPSPDAASVPSTYQLSEPVYQIFVSTCVNSGSCDLLVI